MLDSKLTKNQCKTVNFNLKHTEYGAVDVGVCLRYDDRCGNNHNTFSITADIYRAGKPKTDQFWLAGGCCHDFLEKYIPELAHCVKWHLTSSHEPLHYIANTLYHAGAISRHQNRWFVYLCDQEFGINKLLLGIFTGLEVEKLKLKYNNANLITEEHFYGRAKESNLEAARKTAIWPEASLEELQDENKLKARLPTLMLEFKAFIESLGFTY